MRILNHSEFDLLKQGYCLLTATRRLAREARQEFNHIQLSEGTGAWNSADILTVEAWCQRLWLDVIYSHNNHGYDQKSLLEPTQCNLLWAQIIRQDIKQNHANTEPLWNIGSTVANAMEAWKICQQWDIPIDQCGKSYLPDHRSFSNWAKKYKQICHTNGWVDPHQLIDHLVDFDVEQLSKKCGVSIPKLMFKGFDLFTAQQLRLISWLNHYLELFTLDQLSSNQSTVIQNRATTSSAIFETERQQWLGAGNWARALLEQNPDQRLGIVVPDLHQSRAVVEQAMKEALCPTSISDMTPVSQGVFHISLGRRLMQMPAVKSAVSLLKLIQPRRWTYDVFANLVLNRFIIGSESERYCRAQLEYQLRGSLPFQFSVSDLHGIMLARGASEKAPLLSKTLHCVLGKNKLYSGNKRWNEWVNLLLEWLELFNWPGEATLNSEEFQCVEAFKNEIVSLGQLDLVSKAVSCADVLEVLEQRLAVQPFEPHSENASVEVLGVLESTGIEFDAIWLGNMNDGTWPPTLVSNPFIPQKLVQQSDYPYSIQQRNYQLASAQQHRLLHQCKELVFSTVKSDQDQPLLPSSLFDDSMILETNSLSLMGALHQDTALEIFEDDQGIAQTATLSGGTSLISDQAHCPFRAYIRYRLNGWVEEPRQPGIDLAEWGTLIHKILETIWTEIQSQSRLKSMEDDALRQLIRSSALPLCSAHISKSDHSEPILGVQLDHIESLLWNWLEIEKSREVAFEIHALEKKYQLQLGNLVLNLKIDRVDTVDDSGLVLIDYKTGRGDSISNWMEERLTAPQIPLYLLALTDSQDYGQGHDQNHDQNHNQDQQICAAAYARVRSGDCGFIGVSNEIDFQSDSNQAIRIRPLTATSLARAFENWDEMIEKWSEQVQTLAQEFSAGHAIVDPRKDHVAFAIYRDCVGYQK